MKAIKINQELKRELKEYADVNTTYDGIIMRLIHDVGDYMPMVEQDIQPVNINLHEDTMDMIKSYRLSTGESYENILIRMIILSKSLNKSNE